MQFSNKDIEAINAIIGLPEKSGDNSKTWKMFNEKTGQSLIFSLSDYSSSEQENQISTIVSAQNNQGYFELHNCTSYMIFEPNEIIFIEASTTSISTLTISNEANLSMFANINRRLLHSDLASLEPPLLLSAMQLSLIEPLI